MFWKHIHLTRDPLRAETKPNVHYLGSWLHCCGNPIPEIKDRIHKAEFAWKSLGVFWSRSSIQESFRVTAYKVRVRSVLLSGLETVPFSAELLHMLEVFQMKCLHRLACGRACLRVPRLDADGRTTISYTALTNQADQRMVKVNSIASELSYRRLSRLQHLVASGHKAHSTFAALDGPSYWEFGLRIDDSGLLLGVRTLTEMSLDYLNK